MNDILLILAGGLSAAGLYLHMVRGRRLIVEPMLAADLHPVSKQTLAWSWQWGGVTMVALTVCFLAPILRIDFLPLAMLATVYAYWLGALAFFAMRRNGFRVAQMPQWILFWASSLAGLLAWGLP